MRRTIPPHEVRLEPDITYVSIALYVDGKCVIETTAPLGTKEDSPLVQALIAQYYHQPFEMPEGTK